MTAQTVLGKVPVESLGNTLTHEHLQINFSKYRVAPPQHLKDKFQGGISLKNVGFIRQYPYSCDENVGLKGEESKKAVLQDVHLFKKYGGGTIVENSTHGLDREADFLAEVSSQTGVHIICGTGHYTGETQSTGTLAMSQEDIYCLMKRELTEGCLEAAAVKAGLIGEVASSWPVQEFEKKCIRATAEVQTELNCPVSFHPGRNGKAPWEIMRIYLEAGGKANRAVMSHCDRTFEADENLLEFSNMGTYVQFDLFGNESVTYQFRPEFDLPSDNIRINKIKLLKDEKKIDKILMSHDIHTKHHLIEYGGQGYSHIINNIHPKMLIKGFSQPEIDTICIHNPATWLTFNI